MPGYNSPHEFIACQGPLPGTVDDMWRMVWETNSSVIVMLVTEPLESRRVYQYLPDDQNPVRCGSIVVSLQAVRQYDHWIVREFTLVKAYEIRKLTHYHFISWPDHGVPDPTWTFLDFVRTVRKALKKQASEHPVIVHCNAGVGRTGVYIALDRLMHFMQENEYVDIFRIVCEMRMHRNLMVQTEQQYIFIHECVLDLLRREDDTRESHYVNAQANNEEDTSTRIYCTTIPLILQKDV